MTEPARRRAWPVPGSVRARITALAAVLLALVLAVTATVLVVIQQRTLIGGVDDNLRIRADDIEALVGASPVGTVELATAPDTVAQLVGPDGQVTAASHPAAAAEPLRDAPGVDEEIVTVDQLAIDDDEFRVLSRRLDDGTVLHVAEAVDDVKEGIRSLIAGLAVAIPLVTMIAAAIVWWLVGRTLRPVEAIRTEVEAMAGEDLHRRVPVPRSTDEVSRLARTMNEMLERMEEAQLRQRRFAADASHELRNPLARIRTELEVDLAHPDESDPVATHHSVLEEVDVLQRMIDDLLVLARGEQGPPAAATTLDLDDIVLREAEALRGRPELTLDVSRVSAAQVHGDAVQLARAVRNLLDNAARHADSTVVLSLGELDGLARLTIADDGPGIAPGDRERVFERFTRLDEARSRHDGGTGLGLAISREIVHRHGGTLVIDPDHAPGARLVLGLPLAT